MICLPRRSRAAQALYNKRYALENEKRSVEKAMEKDTGARALRAIIEEFMLDIMYEIPKDDNIGRVTITRDYIEGKSSPLIEIRSEDVHPQIPAFHGKEQIQGV